MTLVLAICVAVTFSVSFYLLLGRELKSVAMGVFLLGHAANLCLIAMSGSPLVHQDDTTFWKQPPVLTEALQNHPAPLEVIVDPLPQALILTAIVISFGVMAFLLALLVITARSTRTLNIDELARFTADAAVPPSSPVASRGADAGSLYPADSGSHGASPATG